jgi:hypothetical protein
MPRPRDDFDTLWPLAFREPAAVLEPEWLYTVAEIARLLQGVEPDADLDPATENVLLDWAIPWIVRNQEEFVFAEPDEPDDLGYYGLRSGSDAGE